MTQKQFGPDRFSRFDVYWIQTNKQTDKLNLYIDYLALPLSMSIKGNKSTNHVFNH